MPQTALRYLVVCLSLSTTIAALAADRRVEGVVKGVDSEKFTITVTTKAGNTAKDETLDVAKKAKVAVNGKAAGLKDVRRGQRAAAVVDGELDVVKTLDATGEGVAALVPEITVLNELPEADVDHTGPWPTADGLTLYWKTRPRSGGGQSWIWAARRKSKDGFFEDAKRLVPGSDMTVSVDGLEMILLQGENLWVTSRPSTDAAFVRPQKLAELEGQGFIAVPCLSGNDLVLYSDRFFPNQPVEPVKSTRANRQAKWGVPAPVKVALPAGKRIRFFSVTPDGSRAFCALFDANPAQRKGPATTTTSVIAMMRAEGAGFGRPEVIKINGEVLHGIFPRYVSATNELFLVRQEEGKAAEIALVRNFDPDAVETAPAGATAKPVSARPDRELHQGKWVSVSEINSGTPLTAEQLRSMNKRMEVRGDRLFVRRTGPDGKVAVFEGAFRLDPSADPKTFDWSAKNPSGSFEMRGIYVLDGDTFRLCQGPERPTELSSTEGNKRQLIVYKREGSFDSVTIDTPPPAAATPKTTKSNQESLQGEWISVSEESGGKRLSAEEMKVTYRRLSIQGGRLVMRRVGPGGKPGVYDGRFDLGSSKEPKTFDWIGKGPEGDALELQGIYDLAGDTFRVCYTRVTPETKRPERFESPAGSRNVLLSFKREGAASARALEPERRVSGGSSDGSYYEVNYPTPDGKPEPKMPVTYTIWIPGGVPKLRGVIVHVHGGGNPAAEAGATAAYDLHWQALAKKWDCAFMAPSCPNVDENWYRFGIPGGGNHDTFLRALRELGEKSNHPELEVVPWCLWGHSGGAIWSGLMQAHDPDRIVAIWLRSGSGWAFAEQDWIPNWRLEPIEKVRDVPVILNLGMGGNQKNPKEEGVLKESLGMLRAFRAKDAPVGLAVDPLTGHNCGDCRLLAIPYFDMMLAMRLPDKNSSDQTLKPVNMKLAWLVDPQGDKAVPAAQYKGDPKQAAWLPNERFARMWMEYVKTGYVTDTTPPPAPTRLKANQDAGRGVVLTWDADVDFESGLRTFIIVRDGERIGRVEPVPSDGSGRPLFQGLSYHDTPLQPKREMRYVDGEPPSGASHTYQVIAVNSAGLQSKPAIARAK